MRSTSDDTRRIGTPVMTPSGLVSTPETRTAGTVLSWRSTPMRSSPEVSERVPASDAGWPCGWNAGGKIIRRLPAIRATAVPGPSETIVSPIWRTCGLPGLCDPGFMDTGPSKNGLEDPVARTVVVNSRGADCWRAQAQTMYSPGRRPAMRYMPRSSVPDAPAPTKRLLPPAGERRNARTIIPTIGSPRSSTTVPEIAPSFHNLTITSPARCPSSSVTACDGPPGRRRPLAPSA